MCLLAMCTPSSEKRLFQFCTHFAIVILLLSRGIYLYSGYMLCKYFLPFCGLSFCSVIIPLFLYTSFNLGEVPLICFSPVAHIFGYHV